MNTTIKNIAYKALDIVTLGKGVPRRVNGRVFRFPARWSRYYQSSYETENYKFLTATVKPGMQLIDIGAHIGLFSAFASQLTGPKGKIVCIEPTPGTFAILQQTLKFNHCDNVTPLQAAVSDKPGEATFYVSSAEGCNSNSLVKNKSEEEASGYKVKLVTIDNIVDMYALTPGLIKIDAEGAELDVLKGGQQTFNRLKPILILGLHPDYINKKGDSLIQIWQLLQQHQYKIMQDGQAISQEEFCNRDEFEFFDVQCS